jgi:predicted DNA-binding protein (UPF0251 family)
MPRPISPRCLKFKPDTDYFKPRGIPLQVLEEVILRADELEALKLHDVDGFDQTEAAGKMKISQPTFNRLLNSTYQKVAAALVKGKAIRLEKKALVQS